MALPFYSPGPCFWQYLLWSSVNIHGAHSTSRHWAVFWGYWDKWVSCRSVRDIAEASVDFSCPACILHSPSLLALFLLWGNTPPQGYSQARLSIQIKGGSWPKLYHWDFQGKGILRRVTESLELVLGHSLWWWCPEIPPVGSCYHNIWCCSGLCPLSSSVLQLFLPLCKPSYVLPVIFFLG